ncbi:hypothetical protein F5144DRAFT_403203 [Chaetomium tenue]|uniref:Uncharacterized protein n=1 Tax=Chaetomium tenue TaxID=1854479 RepID=A0ACB7NVV8_9PEZI|nr:hypothetical protein F5144DRAFT_403203 [Chaetomium globosum]
MAEIRDAERKNISLLLQRKDMSTCRLEARCSECFERASCVQSSKASRDTPTSHQTRAISDISGHFVVGDPFVCKGQVFAKEDAAGVFVIRCSANQDMLNAVKGTVRRTRRRRIIASEWKRGTFPTQEFFLIFPLLNNRNTNDGKERKQRCVAEGGIHFYFSVSIPLSNGFQVLFPSFPGDPRVPSPGAESRCKTFALAWQLQSQRTVGHLCQALVGGLLHYGPYIRTPQADGKLGKLSWAN